MDDNRRWYIYTLVDPRDETIRYVGWTLSPESRLKSHCHSAKRGGTYRAHWINQLLKIGLCPRIKVIEFGSGNWQEAERWWIAHYRNIGSPLTNMTDGGEGTPGLYPGPTTRSKMSIARRGRKATPETIEKLRLVNLGRKQSPEHVAKASAIRKGRVPYIATEAAALANRGRKQSPEHIAKRAAAARGKTRPQKRRLTPDQVRSIRAAKGIISLRKLAKMYGVGQTCIHGVQHRYEYSDIP